MVAQRGARAWPYADSVRASTALLTDHYELTMLQAALASGMAQRRSVFELYPRRLPEGRRYGVVAGVGRALEAIEDFRFDDEVLPTLEDVVDQRTRGWLANHRFSGDVWGYAEGDLYFPFSPLVIVEGTFAEAVLLETLLLSIYNHDSAIASAASRMTQAAGGRPCIEMGSRRTHEQAAVAAARAAYIAGLRHQLQPRRPPAVRRPHGRDAAPTASPSSTTPRPTRSGRRSHLSVAGRPSWSTPTTSGRQSSSVSRSPAPSWARSGSTPGDQGALAHEVRAELDALGATKTRIIVTSDLDEFQIAALAAAPVDGYGVGTQLVTGSGHPTCGFVYKLVAREDDDGELVAVAKKSKDKISIGGRKWAMRRLSSAGVAEAEVIGVGKPPENDGDDRELLVPLVRDGEVVGGEPLDVARDRHASARGELPHTAEQMSKGEPVIPTQFV